MKTSIRLLAPFLIWLSGLIQLPGLVLSQEIKKIPTAAVLDLKAGSGVTVEEATTLTDKFRAELNNTNTFVFLTRNDMQKIAKEHEFSLSGDCNNADCAVEVGQLLSAAKIITGSVGKLGQTYSLTVMIVDVTTGKEEKVVTQQYSGSIDEIFKNLDDIAVELVGEEAAVDVKIKKGETAAVLDFQMISGINKEESMVLSDKFRASLSATKTYVFLSRNEMQNIAKEQDFSLSDICTNTSCAVEIGQILSASKIITGTIGKVGQTYSVTGRIIDVSTGKEIRVVSDQYSGPIDGLFKIFDQVALKLVGKYKPSRAWIYWVGGAAVTGGTAIYLLTRSSSKGSLFGEPPANPNIP